MIQPFWRYISKSYSLCPSLLIPAWHSNTTKTLVYRLSPGVGSRGELGAGPHEAHLQIIDSDGDRPPRGRAPLQQSGLQLRGRAVTEAPPAEGVPKHQASYLEQFSFRHVSDV